MTIEIQESNKTRDVTRDINTYTTDAIFVVKGDSGDIVDENNALLLGQAGAPAFIDGLPQFGASVVRFSEFFYEVTITYKRNSQDEENPDEEQGQVFDYTLDTGGGTTHITNGLEVISQEGTSDETGTALGVQQDGKVEGIDIVTPAFNFSVTKKFTESEFTPAMVTAIYEKGGKVNSQNFTVFGVLFTPRDVKFLYASAQISDQPDVEGDMWTVTYYFSAIKSLENHFINKKLTVPAKAGWDYLQVFYTPQADAEIGKVLPVAYGYKVIRVFEAVSFNDIGVL